MKEIILYLEKETGEKNLANMPWKKIVDTVILPKMAGQVNLRWCIADGFMNFVGKFAREIQEQDSYTATAMFEIALQRLSCGAIEHEPTPWPEPLPREYWEYSSKYDESHILTEGCRNFIMNAMEYCIRNNVTRSHAIKILFGIQEGRIHGNLDPEAIAKMVNLSSELLLKFATFDELYRCFATPTTWMNHKKWFAKNIANLNWDKFFEDIKCAQGENFFQRWRKRREVKTELKQLSSVVKD